LASDKYIDINNY